MTTQITLPPNTRTIGQGDPPADMDRVVTALMAMSATSYCMPTGDTSGANDATNISAALAANKVVVLGPGTYYLNATIGPLVTGQWITCMPGVLIYWKGTGDCFRFVDTSTYTSRASQGAGILGRPLIDGTNDGAGSCALHAGDILGLRFDIAVQNFSKSGDVAIHLDNQNYQTEQATGIAYISGCTGDVVFDCGGATTSNGSFDRGEFVFNIQHTSLTSSFTWQNGAYQTGGKLRVYGNYTSSNSTFTAAAFNITGQAPGGHTASYSNLYNVDTDIDVESDEGLTYTFQSINFGSINNTVNNCHGSVSFGAGNQFTQSNVTTLSSQFTFFGPVVGDSSLAEITAPNRLAVNGEIFLHGEISTTLAASVSYKPSNPVGTVSGTAVMMGLGSTCTFTPGLTGKVRVTICGTWYTATGTTNGTVSGRYGTGTAPANGAAVTGTRFGTGSSDATLKEASSGAGTFFSVTEILSLTAGDTYWFDLAESTTSTSDETETGNVVCSIDELLA